MQDIPVTLNLWTTATPAVIDTGKPRAREALLDIRTGSSHRWGSVFAPPHTLTNRRQNDRSFNDRQFVDAYTNLLRRRFNQQPAAFDALLQHGHLVLFSEHPPGIGEFDHRHVLVRLIRQMAIQQGIHVNYRGELHPDTELPGYQRTMTLMIAGSRHATPDMLAAADRTVRQAMFRGWQIVVGDNPQGVDAAVVKACRRYGASCIVAGIQPKPRNGGYPYQPMGRTFTERDRLLCQLADVGVFIWNGESTGTRNGLRYMHDDLNKPALIMNYRHAA